VQVDINMITAVIRNLMINAIKFCEKGQHITIEAAQYDEKYLKIMIRDEGIGLTQEEIKIYSESIKVSQLLEQEVKKVPV